MNQEFSYSNYDPNPVVVHQGTLHLASEPFLSTQIYPNFFSSQSRDYWYRVKAKNEAYNHFLDLQTQYRDLSNEVSSWSINRELWRLYNEISWARFSWESIQVPPFEEQFVNRVQNTEATKNEEEVFIEDSVAEFSEDITPNSASVAIIDSILHSDPISGSKIDSDKGLNGFSKSTSTIEESTISIGDFTVSTFEEIKSIPTGVVEEGDSIDFVDDSSDLQLIPLFFFVENDVDDSTEAVSFQFTVIDKTEVNNVERKYQIKW
ncbi:hypothetical protein MKW92_030575, partial [Papaver armeniacum]